MLWEDEVCGVWAVDTGQWQAARLNSRPLRALGVLARQRRCGVGTAEPLGPCGEPMVPDWLCCLTASVCVLYEYLCQCAFVQRYAHGRLFVPQTVRPLLFLFQSDSLLSMTLCLFPSVCLPVQQLPQAQPPVPLSVLPAALLSHFTPACHIPSYLRGGYIPLPWEAATSKRLSFLVVGTVGRRSVRTDSRAGLKQGGKLACLLAAALAGNQPSLWNRDSKPF